MARRRPTRRGKATSPKTRRYFAESLEPRKYMVVLHAGDVFEFWADNNHMERVIVQGNSGSTTVELIGLRTDNFVGLAPGQTPVLDGMNGQIVAGPDAGVVGQGIDPAAFQNGGAGAGNNANIPTFTNDIYAIYVSKSDLSSHIAIAGVPTLATANRPMQPYTGSQTLSVGPNSGGANISVSVNNSGTAILGARTSPPQNNGAGGGGGVANFPVNVPVTNTVSFPVGTFPTLPSNQTTISPGLTVQQGNNLGAFMFGGIVMGSVNIQGSIPLFYAGWLLTGQTVGRGGTGTPVNFNVDGDIQNLVTIGSIGTNTDSGLADLGAPNYTTGFNMHVGGRVGMVKTLDSFVGSIDVGNDPNAPGLAGLTSQQIDRRVGSWDNTILAGVPGLSDDNFLGAQFLAPLNSNGDIVVSGQIESNSAQQNKAVDYYAVPLLAGQTINTRLESSLVGGLNLGVFDSQRRLIATDYSFADPTTINGQTFQFTAKLPGVYYFAVAGSVNNTFTAGFTPLVGTIPYTLFVSGAGNLGIGGIVAANNILDTGSVATTGSAAAAGFHLTNGDIGAAFCGGLVISNDGGLLGTGTFGFIGAYTFVVDNGNLRDVEGASLGNGIAPGGTSTTSGVTVATAGAYGEWPTGLVPNGSVGMLRATSATNTSGQGGTGILAWNVFGLSLTTGAGQLVNPLASEVAIGGDYQMVDGANIVDVELVANGNIGTVRANSMATTSPSYFQVNAANDPTKRGTIDLIDCTNNLGTLGAGGPAIITGIGGDCRYIHVGPTGTIFRDSAFGGGQPEATLFAPGESALITDDSGENVSISPENAADSLTVITYGIRGSGGSAIVRISVSNTTTPTAAGGVNVVTSGGDSAEIGSIILNGTGTAVTPGAAAPATPATGGTTTPPPVVGGVFPAPGTNGGAPLPGPAAASTAKFTLPTLPSAPSLAVTTNPMDVSLSGDGPIDVYEITGPIGPTGNVTVGAGQVTSITNTTPNSEIVNVHLSSLGSLSTSGSVGITLKKGTAATVTGNLHNHLPEDGTSGAPYTYPLFQVSSLVRVLGNVVSISAAGGIGNIYTGVISNVPGAAVDPVPPANGTALPVPAGGGLQGANGAIGSVGGHIMGAVVAAGSINRVQANGIDWSGSGATNAVGIFSAGVIGPVNVNGDDSGMIVSTQGQTGLTINNGSLNQGTVADYVRFDYAEARRNVTVTVQATTPFTRPKLDIGSINVNGTGGIIGSDIDGEHIGPVNVADSGFGIFDTFFSVLGDGTFMGITGGGYGIRDVTFAGGATLGAITARGDGSSIPVTNFPKIVRQSETSATFNSITGQVISALNDLDFYLGTTAGTPIVSGSTESGVIENVVIVGSRDVGSMNAWSIRGRTVVQGNTFLATSAATIVNVANMVNTINVAGPVDEFFITTGRTGKYNFNGDVANFGLFVAGPIGNLVFNSSLLESSQISAQGPAGRIASILVKGNFSGLITAKKNIGKVTIQGSMIGSIHAATLGTLKLTGGLGSGSLQIDGNVGTIQTVGDLGVPGNTLTVNGSLGTLNVGGNLNTNVTVSGNLTKMLIAGSVLSATNAAITGTIDLLQVGGDIQAGAVISAHLIKKKVIKGQILGTITTA